jgi:hypothetical protein
MSIRRRRRGTQRRQLSTATALASATPTAVGPHRLLTPRSKRPPPGPAGTGCERGGRGTGGRGPGCAAGPDRAAALAPRRVCRRRQRASPRPAPILAGRAVAAERSSLSLSRSLSLSLSLAERRSASTKGAEQCHCLSQRAAPPQAPQVAAQTDRCRWCSDPGPVYLAVRPATRYPSYLPGGSVGRAGPATVWRCSRWRSSRPLWRWANDSESGSFKLTGSPSRPGSAIRNMPIRGPGLGAPDSEVRRVASAAGSRFQQFSRGSRFI